MRRPLWTVCLCIVALIAVWLWTGNSSEGKELTDSYGHQIAEGDILKATGRVYQVESRASYGRQCVWVYLEEVQIEKNQIAGAQETQSQETQSQETQSQETQSQEIQSQKTQSREIQSQEIQSQEIQSQEIQSQKTQSRETQSQETQSREIQSQELQIKDLQVKEKQIYELQNEESLNKESQIKENQNQKVSNKVILNRVISNKVISNKEESNQEILNKVTLNRENQKNLSLETQSKESKSKESKSNLICEIETAERPKLGSIVQIEGQFSYFSKATNPGQFDTEQYYRVMGIGGKLKSARLLAQSTEFSHMKECLYALRCHWKERLYNIFPEREASVMTAMLLGDKAGLDSEWKELYQRNGMIHILSISGLHITIIGMGIYRLLRKIGCPVTVAAVGGGLLLLLYGVLTGMGVSACRAIGMFLIRMAGEMLGRTYDMQTALGVMAVVMLAGQPEYLRHSGFLLSFGSVCGIVILLPALTAAQQEPGNASEAMNSMQWEAGKSGLYQLALECMEKIKQAFLAGISITVFTLPIHLCIYYEYPVYSIFLNMAVLPLMGLLVPLGLAAMLLPGMTLPGRAAVKLAGLAAEGILGVYETMCRGCDKLPWNTWTPGCPAVWQIAVFYLILAAAAIWGRRLRFRWKGVLLALAVLILGCRWRTGLTVIFLDVGQGDCILVQTDAGENFLFDGGSSSQSRIGKYVIVPCLKYYGISKLDAVFVSHPDEDHCNGILELLQEGAKEGIDVERLVLPAIEEGRRTEELGELLAAAEESGEIGKTGEKELEEEKESVPVGYISSGARWKSGEAVFTCLHPPEGWEAGETNAYSQCFLIEYGSFSMLLTGDVEGLGEDALEKELLAGGIGNITVLKAAHHGSRYSTSDGLLELLKPQMTVISCGKDNRYGHPHEELLERLDSIGTRVLATPQTGAVILRTDGSRCKTVLYSAEEE